MLVVDDFGVKYTRKRDVDHLLVVLKREFTAISEDWNGKLYCGITLVEGALIRSRRKKFWIFYFFMIDSYFK